MLFALVMATGRLCFWTVGRPKARGRGSRGHERQEQGRSDTKRRSRRRRVRRALLGALASVALFVSLFSAYVAYEWIRAPGIDDLRPVGVGASLMAARGH